MLACSVLTFFLFVTTLIPSLFAYVANNSIHPRRSRNVRLETKESFPQGKLQININEDSSNSALFQNANNNLETTAHHSRRDILVALSSLSIPVLTVFNSQVRPASAIPDQKSYSSNARNMNRLSGGDQSGGSLYDNSSTNPKSAKRRAMVGCRFGSSRKKAAGLDGMTNDLSERECNLRVLDGDSEFMLKALRELDCEECPYGIQGA